MPEYVASQIPVADILVDPEFNCRGVFTPQSVKELADTIVEVGRLICPVVVQPWNKEGFKYRLIVGFRRMRAVTFFLKWTKILAHVADVTEHEARVLNLVENLERKNLNILEEANGLRRIYPAKVTIAQAAAELKKPKEWVRARFALLRLPPAMQQQAAAGMLSANDILHLVQLTSDEQLAFTRRVVERRALPKYRIPPHKEGKHARPTATRIRYVVRQMLQWGIDGLPTRALAWSAGDIGTEELMEDVKRVVQTLRDSVIEDV
jgi:ParB/RepB/Spo0J family partition protein